ncbi:Superfamily I DNA or RNA helicase [Sanguibacter gelidistatuariae]|uniref:DNA 3'-5' helicase n=2 Tax=Sanguibacter gelidistatuariae TaxID=1814289 RepID=A0A1G6L234_9MICO|nr:Superfamily I DNA or RNA helicase [Sanguibacter gelidistatuariae]
MLDAAQVRALEGALAAPTSLILGAPGTGKTTLALEIAATAVERDGLDPDEILVLSATRRGAGLLRDALAARLGMTVRGAVVRTAASAAFAILTKHAQAAGDPVPVLITGPEQDLALAELLAGHAHGEGVSVPWPATIPAETLALRGFREELRDLLMRSAERGLTPDDLCALGRRYGRPEWEAAGRLYDEYLSVMALRQLTPDSGARYDPAVVVDEAAHVFERWSGPERPAWRLVVVDDYQEATAATARLCHGLASAGARLVLLGDPDASAQAFRGATPALIGRAAAGRPPVLGAVGGTGDEGEFGATTLVLETAWRHGPAIREATQAVTQEIGSVGAVEHRRAEARPGAVDGSADGDGDGDGVVETAILPSPALEEAHIAKTLRSENLLRGTPWSQMVVIARSGSELLRLRRALTSASVPVTVLGADIPLRDEPAVRPLLGALRAAVSGDIPVEAVVDLLTSPLGGMDAVGLRRLRRALRTDELSAGGGRSSDALLVEMIANPAQVELLPSDVARAPRRITRVLAAGRMAIEAPGATAQTVLWALWAAADVAETWRSIAVNGGPGSARADRDLDAVMALFRSAEQFVDRVPQATALAFADFLQSQDLPADNLARAGATETVSLLTPAGAAGGEWDVVIVAGLQDGSWPDLRLRDSLLGSQALVDVLSGRSADAAGAGREARRSVLADELRAFAVAVSRATRRLVVTAASDTDNEPSVFVELLTGPDDEDETGASAPDVFAAPLDLRGVVATLRTELAEAVGRTDGAEGGRAIAALLARLARAGVGEADPRTWYGSAQVSSGEGLWAPGEAVMVSPSKVEQVHRCALRWALESAGGTGASALSQSVGTLIHDIARELPTAGHAALAAELDRRWHELGLPQGWPTTQTRRRADAMILRLSEYYKEISGDVVVEEAFEVMVGRAVLRGAVDRLELSGVDGVRVTDLKTGKGIPTVPEGRTNAQLGAYQLAVEAGAFASLPPGTRSVGAQLVFLSDGAKGTRRGQDALGPDPENWARTLVEDAAETMAGAAFTATENSLCSMCGVRRSCPLQSEGRQVVDLGLPGPAARSTALREDRS